MRIARVDAEMAEVDRALWRLHTPTGPHPLCWDHLRSYGLLTSARFDPWPPPTDHGIDPETSGVGYFALDIPSCLAEVFQTCRGVDLGGGVQLTGFSPTRPLALLDLRTDWPIAIGASHLINSGPKDRCRAWAYALRSAHPGCDGLLCTGMAGRDCLVLYAPSADAFPATPAFTTSLADPPLDPYLADAAEQIRYAVGTAQESVPTTVRRGRLLDGIAGVPGLAAHQDPSGQWASLDRCQRVSAGPL